MAILDKIDSNVTGLSITPETTPGVVPSNAQWVSMQPNSYGNLGGQLGKTARAPISQLRQNRKGVTTDLDAAGEFEQDITMYLWSELWPGLFLANKIKKPTDGGRFNPNSVASVAAGTLTLSANADDARFGGGFLSGHLVHSEFFGVAANNSGAAAREVTGVTGADLTIAGTAVEASPPADAVIRAVGFQFGAGEAAMVRAAGEFPQLVITGGQDLTALGLNVGETIIIGGLNKANLTDNAVVPTLTRFDTNGNNGKFRIRSITATTLTFDLSDGGNNGTTEATAEAGGAKTIRIYFSDIVRNVASDNAAFNQQTYALERTLGAPDDAATTEIQAETVDAAIWNGAGIEMPTADKMVISAEFLATNNTNFRGTTGNERPSSLDGGSVVQVQESDAFNTTDNVPDIRIYTRSADPAAVVPAAFFAFVGDLTMNVSNNATPLKAIGRLGAFAVTAGNFTVANEMTAYFQTTTALQSVRDNDDVGMFAFMNQTLNGRRAGMLIDQPFGSTTTDGLNVEADAAITVPLTFDAAVDPNFLFTMIIHEFWFLPN